MPIKLPKGFQRRKSSGNALDELQNPPASSTFRVIERPEGKPYEGGRVLRSAGPGLPTADVRNSFDQDEEDLFSVARPDATNRGSGGTDKSVSTSQYDSAASSRRLSTSTTPSSVDTKSDRYVQAPFKDIPVPPAPTARPGGFLRNSARTFSLGVGIKSSKEQNIPPAVSPAAPPMPAIHPANTGETRGRALTASSASTATPPKLYDSDLAFDNSEMEGFGNMFEDIGRSRDASPALPSIPSSPPTSYPPSSFPNTNSMPIRNGRAPAANGIYTSRHDALESSPYSYNSPDSRDGLMRSPSPSKTITQNSPSLRSYASPTMTTPRPFNSRPVPPENYNSYDESPPQVPSHRLASDRSLSKVTSNHSATDHDHLLDPHLMASAELANRYQEAKPTGVKAFLNKKVMTPAQFERYKQQHEMDRRLGASADDDSEEEADNYDDDDDDIEKEKTAAQQRRKQEAHLAVYRQQMMKVTGEQAPQRSASSLSSHLDPRFTASTPELNRLSNITASTKLSSKSSGEEEEDEDVPLGILAAHGFPNKNRPPTQLAHSSSNSNLRAVSQSQAAAPSVAGAESTKRGSLPVFARQLPQDPYYGAGLVNQSNRESMGMQNSSLAPMAGSIASTAHPHHPAGLVGVIAGEEKARAMRRGSPNLQGGFDLPPGMQHPGMVRSQTTGHMGQMPGMMPPMPMMSPGDHAQLQMSQQMTQMMQMQMQWMQQMTQMISPGQQLPPMMPGQPMPPQMMGPPGPAPSFMGSPGEPSHRQSMMPPPLGQRSMSTLSPSMANWNAASQNNYAHSIAPSERSNIGLASRYRPVSIAQDPEPSAARRASTFTSTTSRPWSRVDPQAQRLSSYVHSKPNMNPVGRKSPLAVEEEDDEQGWAEMKAKKDKKTRTWKMRKEQNTLKELYNGVP